MKNEFKPHGIVHITGEPDSGKTSAALECGVMPDGIWFLDDDVKGRATVQQLLSNGIQFGRYDDLVALGRGKREVEFHEACLRLLDGVHPGEYQAIIWDTWARFAKTCHDYVLAHPQKFRMSWATMGQIKGAQQWLETRRYEAELLHRLNELAETVIIVTHLKSHTLSGVQTGKQVPDASVAIQRVASLRLWLMRNPKGGTPLVLVLKRIDKKVLENGHLRTVAVLPPKLTPRPDERSIWDVITRYWNNPISNRPLLPEETPDEYELSVIRGTLTADQQRVFELLLRSGLTEPEAIAEPDALTAQAQALRSEGKTLPEIANILGISVPEVAELLAGE